MAPPKQLKRPVTLQVTLSARRGTALRRALAKQPTKVKYPSHHTLSIASELKSDVSSIPRPLTVAVRKFESPAYLRQGRIVYSQTPGEVGFYEYHRWVVDPGARRHRNGRGAVGVFYRGCSLCRPRPVGPPHAVIVVIITASSFSKEYLPYV
jgi:hypothetical protein